MRAFPRWNRLRTNRWLRVSGQVLFLLVYVTLGFASFFHFLLEKPDFFSQALIFDYRIYERAVIHVWQGINPYLEHDVGRGFIYPPPALLFLSGTYLLRLWPLPLKAGLIWAVNLVAMGGLVALVMRWHRRTWAESWWWYVLTLTSLPFLVALFEGQVDILLLWGLVLLWWMESLPSSLIAAGWMWASWLKVTPLVFLLPLWSKRRYRTWLWAGGIIMGLVLLTIVLWGTDLWINYFGLFKWMTNLVLLDTEAFVAKVYHALPYGPWRIWFRSHPEVVRWLQRGHTLYLFFLILLSNGLAYRFKTPGKEHLLLTFAAFPLLPSIVWEHHFTFFFLPLMFWWASAPSGRRSAWVAGGMLLFQINHYALFAGLPWSRVGLGIYLFIHAFLLYLLGQQIRQIRRRSTTRPFA